MIRRGISVQERGQSVTDARFNCGHPRTPENSRPNSGGNGKPYDRCRTCQNARNAEFRSRTREAPSRRPAPTTSSGVTRNTRPPLASVVTANGLSALCRPATPLDLSGDPDVVRYHQEKAKRADRKRPDMEAAERVWKAQLETERAARKGGRPKQKFVIGKPRPKDLADLLPRYTHGQSSDRR